MSALSTSSGLLLCVLCYSVGRLARPVSPTGESRAPSLIQSADSPAGNPALPPTTTTTSTDWDTLARQSPTPENRWRALTLFAAWAREDPAHAVQRLAAMDPAACTLWPDGGALREFFCVWAEADPDQAWAAALKRQDPTLTEAVATILARLRPELVLASDVSEDTKLLALARQAESATDLASLENKDPRLVEHWLMCRPLTADTLAQAEANLPGDSRSDAIARRLVEASRAEVLSALTSQPELSPFDKILYAACMDSCTPENTEETLAFVSKAPGPPSNDPFAANGRPDFSNAVRHWKSEDLLAALTVPLPPDSLEDSPRLALQSASVNELLARDPAALLPWLTQAQKDAGDLIRWQAYGGISGSPPVTPENAAGSRILIEAAPPDLQPILLRALMPSLLEYDLPFLIEIASQAPENPGEAQSENTASLLQRWLPQDTAAATAWLNAHPDIPLESTVNTWAGNDPESSSQWVDSLPNGKRKDEAIKGLVSAIGNYDPDAAAAWIGKISDLTTRQWTAFPLIDSWKPWHPEAAAAAAATLAVPPP